MLIMPDNLVSKGSSERAVSLLPSNCDDCGSFSCINAGDGKARIQRQLLVARPETPNIEGRMRGPIKECKIKIGIREARLSKFQFKPDVAVPFESGNLDEGNISFSM